MPADPDLLFMPATQAAALIRKRALSPVEYMQAVLSHAESQQPRCNPFATLCADEAMEGARAAEQAVMDGGPLGPLHGLPVTVKDLFATSGIRTAYGSAMHLGNVPQQDDVLVARLKAAGAVLVGKTTTPEFGNKGVTDSPSFGTTRNPWDLARTSGGSSGGAGVAAALGIGPLHLGSDGAGSVRIPAACCGVVGLKPTTGAVPFQDSKDIFGNNVSAGPMTRTVADAALMLATLRGPDTVDPWGLNPAPEAIPTALTGPSLHGLRIGVIRLATNPELDPDMEANTRRSAAALAARGADVEDVTDVMDWNEYPRPHRLRRQFLRRLGRQAARVGRPHGPDAAHLHRPRQQVQPAGLPPGADGPHPALPRRPAPVRTLRLPHHPGAQPHRLARRF